MDTDNPTLPSDAAIGQAASCYVVQTFSHVDGYWRDLDAFDLSPLGYSEAKSSALMREDVPRRIIKRTEEVIG